MLVMANGSLQHVSDELYHHGVKGMKWGVRKKRPESKIASDVRRTKEAYKKANKEYKKSFNKAYDKSAAAYSPLKKHRKENDARWDDAFNKADAANKAQAAYKQAKKTRKEALKSTTKQLNKEASFLDKMTYNDATRKKAAKYIVDNDMSVADATKKAKGEAWRNTAIFIAGYGAIAVASSIRG